MSGKWKAEIRARDAVIALRNVGHLLLFLVLGAVLLTTGLSPRPVAAADLGQDSACAGNNGFIESGSGLLESLKGTYCLGGDGKSEINGKVESKLSCELSVDGEGYFSLTVGENVMKFRPADHTTADARDIAYAANAYAIKLTGTENVEDPQTAKQIEERYEASIYIHAKSLFKVMFWQQKYDGLLNVGRAQQECEFAVTSHAQNMPLLGSGSAHFSSAAYLPPSAVGKFSGTTYISVNGVSKSMSCTLDITANGTFTLWVPMAPTGQYVTRIGELDGRYFDTAYKTEVGDSYYATTGIASTYRNEDWPGVVVQVKEGTPFIAQSLLGSSQNPELCMIEQDIPPCEGDDCIPEHSNCGRMTCEGVGNPMHSANGNKFQHEVDYVGSGTVGLRFERFYNSHTSVRPGAAGWGWRTTFDRSLQIARNGNTVLAHRPDGKRLRFSNYGGWEATAMLSFKLATYSSADLPDAAWQLTDEFGDTELYHKDGRLLMIRSRDGRSQKLEYVAGQLARVVDSFGRALSFTYDEHTRLRTMRDPQDNLFVYTYNEKGLLADVEAPGYPNQTHRRYIYDNPRFPTALTGIEDEKGIRFATWKYDDKGRAYHSEHAGGIDRVTLAFGTAKTTVTDPLGTVRTYRFETVEGGQIRLDGIDQPAGAGSSAASSYYDYDMNGNLKSWINFNGVKTSYVFDLDRDLEKSRIEADGTPKARKISTEWHPQYRLPVRIAEPKRLTTFYYLPNGDLDYKTVEPTNDTTGALGLAVKPSGPPIKFSYTYYDNRLLKSVFEPQFEGKNLVNETYTWEQGNLATITNAAGHVTTFRDYNAHGLPQTVISPNGVETKITYYPRGAIETSTDIAGQRWRTTRYEYEPTGKLKRVTFPDGANVTYGYDDAQRLRSITDSVGNTIIYELDNAGNRLSESVNDVNNVLRQRITRVYDELGRVKKVTGAAQ